MDLNIYNKDDLVKELEKVADQIKDIRKRNHVSWCGAFFCEVELRDFERQIRTTILEAKL